MIKSPELNPACKYCGGKTVKYGRQLSFGEYLMRYRCKSCRQIFNRLDTDKGQKYSKVLISSVLQLLEKGETFRGIKTRLGLSLSESTIHDWLVRHGDSDSLIVRKRHLISNRQRVSYGLSLIKRHTNIELSDSLKTPMPEFYPFAGAAISNNILQIVHDAVPRGIPDLYRQDICQEMIVDILDGKLDVKNVLTSVSSYIKRIYKQFGNRYQLSLDSPIFEDGDRTLLDTLDESRIINKW